VVDYTAHGSYRSPGGTAIEDLHFVAENSETVISNFERNHRVRVCPAAVEAPGEGSLPELGLGLRSDPCF
jgi:hypothetical protein